MSDFVGFIVGAALVVIGIVTGNPLLIVQGGAMIVSNAVLLLTAPKQPARQASEMSIQLGEQPRCMVLGEAFVAGSLVDGFNYGGKYGTDWECLIIRLADHKCEGMIGFFVNDEYVPYAGNGNYPQFDSNHFELYFRADTTTEPLPSVVTTNAPGWEATDIGESGCDVVVCYRADLPDAEEPAWPGGRPRFGFVLRGALCYDPRLDDTVDGGAGPHRDDDPATWEWSENAAICRYKWVRGVYANDDVSDQGALLVGRGLTAEEAPPENIIAAANLCGEEMAGDGLPYDQTDDSGLGGFSHTSPMTTNPQSVWMIRYVAPPASSPIEWWDLPTRTLIGTSEIGGPDHSGIENIDIAADGTAYGFGQYTVGLDVHSALWTIEPLADAVRTESDRDGAWFSAPTRVFDIDGGHVVLTGLHPDYESSGYLLGGQYQASAHGLARDFCLANGEIATLYEAAGSSADFIIECDGVTLTVTGLVTRSEADTAAAICHVPAFSHYFVVTDGKFYCVDDTSGTIKTSGDYTLSTLNLPRKSAATSFWVNGSTGLQSLLNISLEDGSTIVTKAATEWVAENLGGPVVFDYYNNAMISVAQSDDDHLTWRYMSDPVRYRVAGPIYSNQDFIEVEGMFAAATGGTVVTREGSVELEPGAAKSVVATITDDDLLSGSKVVWNQRFLSESNDEWLNTVVPTYVEPEQKWNSHNAPPLRDTDDILADGRPRETQLTLRLVRDLVQAQRVGEIARRMARLWGRASLTLGPRFCELEDGDWINWQSDRYLGGGTLTFRIDAYQIDAKWQNTLTLREISVGVYADGLTFAPDLSEIPPRVIPPAIGAPAAENWGLTSGTLESAGATIPILIVTGNASDDSHAEAIIIEYWLSDGVTDPVADPGSIQWVTNGSYPPSTTRVEIGGLVGEATYYVAIAYVVSGARGPRLVLGPETVADYDSPAPSADAQYVGGKTATVLSTDTGVISLTDLTGGLDTAPSAGDVVVLAIGISRSSTPPAHGVTTAGYITLVTASAPDVYHSGLRMAAKGMGATPDTSVSVIVPANSDAYCTVGIHVWRDVVAHLSDQTATGSNYGRPDPPSITTDLGNIIVAAGVAAGSSIPVVTSSDLGNFLAVASGSGTIGIGSKISTAAPFNPAEFGGGDTSGSSSWASIIAAFLSDDGGLTDTPATLETATTGSGSTSAFAAKGSIYAFHSNATLVDATTDITPSGSETYKLVVAELDRSNVITAVLGSSATQTFSAAGARTYTLSSPVDIKLGARIAFIMVRTDGTSTSVNRIPFPTTTGAEDARMDYIGCIRYATVNPAVSDSVLLNSTSVARMTIGYEYPA